MNKLNNMSIQIKIIKVFFIINIIVTGLTAKFLSKSKALDDDNYYNLLRKLDHISKFSTRDVKEFGDFFEQWPGRHMPEMPSDPEPSKKVFHKSQIVQPDVKFHSSGRIPMGVKSSDCDDGKTNLAVDWDNSPVNHTCYGRRIVPDYDIISMIYCEIIPPLYTAIHKCMTDVIEYKELVPVFGTHRPIWAVYGEYKFLPRQRWLHNLEHGAIVMLYHPCANPLEIKVLKKIVKDCLSRYIISPSNLVDTERPLVLVSWGCRLSMSVVDPDIAQQFILDHALKGPEKVATNGDFEEGLLERSEVVQGSDDHDTNLCPKLKHIQKIDMETDKKTM